MKELTLRSIAVPLLLSLFVFAYIGVFVFSNNIHDDGLVHTTSAREIATTGQLLQHRPHHVMSVDQEGNPIYLPLSYPQTSQVTMALFYLLGQETAIKFFSPLFALLTAMFLYLLLREISRPAAFLAALFAVLINTDRFIMVPLMEQALLAMAVMSIYFYRQLLAMRQMRYAILTALFLGLCISIKQQGFIVFAAVSVHWLAMAVVDYRNTKNTRVLTFFAVAALLTAAIAAGPLLEQIGRNGTLDYVPGNSRIPFLQSNFPADPEAAQLQDELIGYWPSYDSILAVVVAFASYPLSFSTFTLNSAATVGVLTLAAVLLILSISYLYRRQALLLSVLISVLLGEILLAYWSGTPVGQYHVVGLAMWATLLVLGLFGAYRLTRMHKIANSLTRVIIICAAFGICAAPLVIFFPPWNNSGRYDDQHLVAFQDMGNYVKENTPEDAIFVAANEGFMYYGERDAIWLTEGGGAKIPLIFSTEDESVALYWLEKYDISFVLIDTRQTERQGLFDYIPSSGLIRYIDTSPHFTEVHSIDVGPDQLRLYRIIA